MKLVYFLLRRFIFRLGFRSGFTHTKTTKCELASLKQHILLNVFAHINLFPTSTKCRQIETPHRITASPLRKNLLYVRKQFFAAGFVLGRGDEHRGKRFPRL